MIATRRGLAVLGAIAVVLLVILAIDLSRTRVPVDRALLPGFDEASVTRLMWTAHPVGPYLMLERTAGQTWRRTHPSPGAVEQAPIANLLATLRGARWHRSEQGVTYEDGGTQLSVGGRELWIGRPIAGGDQVWIRIGDRSYLVDAWVARALLPSPIDLAITKPLANIASAPSLTIDGIELAGTPRALVTPSGRLVLDHAVVDQIERSLGSLEIEDLPLQPLAKVTTGIAIEIMGMRVVVGAGPGDLCEPRVPIAATSGGGCISLARADAVRAVVTLLRSPIASLAERAPVPFGIETMSLPDGTLLDLRKRSLVDGRPADDTQVVALMTVLRVPVDQTALVAAPTTPPTATMVVNGTNATLRLELHAAERTVHRVGEPIALRLDPGAFALVSRTAAAYQDQTPWREDPIAIDEITIDRATWKRGAALGEWTRTPAGSSDVASIDALVTALAAPRVIGVAPTTVPKIHQIQLVVRPPVGDPIVHTIELGAPMTKGCPAILDGNAAMLDAQICRLVPR